MRLGESYSVPDRFVSELRDYDPALRVRWGRAQRAVRVERKVARAAERSLFVNMNALSPRAFDDLEMARDGYELAVNPFPPADTNWPKMLYTVALSDLQRLGGAQALADKLEAEEAYAKERRRWNMRDDFRHHATALWRSMNTVKVVPEGAGHHAYGPESLR